MKKNRGSASGYRRQDGFTLIELLVVISVIGILAVIVLTSLSSAGEKGANAGIKSDATTLRTEAQVRYANQNQSFDGFCGDAIIATTNAGKAFAQACDLAKLTTACTSAIVTGATAQTDSLATEGNGTLYCNAGARFYVVSVPLRAIETKGTTNYNFWCVDSAGYAGGVTKALKGDAKTCSDLAS
jgi:prepilin-type N-terminal cleavage/methylation domain-containing protein